MNHTKSSRALLSGNEAIARGAWESGVTVATGYPGTPSTEILEAARVHAQRGEPSDSAPLRADLEGFLEEMRRHEQAEEALLSSALERESASRG